MFGMMIENKTYLKTTPQYLFEWLKNEIKNARQGINPDITYTEPNRIIYITFQLHQDISGNRYDIPANAWIHGIGNDHTKSTPFMWDMIMSFEALPLSENNVQVIGRYINIPGVKEYFDKLWETMSLVFPKPEHIERIENHEKLHSTRPSNIRENKAKMTEWRKRRQGLFLEIHHKFPDLTQIEVAAKATTVAHDRERIQLEQDNPGKNVAWLQENAEINIEEKYNKTTFSRDDVKNDLGKQKLW